MSERGISQEPFHKPVVDQDVCYLGCYQSLLVHGNMLITMQWHLSASCLFP